MNRAFSVSAAMPELLLGCRFFAGLDAQDVTGRVWYSQHVLNAFAAGYHQTKDLASHERMVVYLATADNSAASGRVPRQPTTRITLPQAVF